MTFSYKVNGLGITIRTILNMYSYLIENTHIMLPLSIKDMK